MLIIKQVTLVWAFLVRCRSGLVKQKLYHSFWYFKLITCLVARFSLYAVGSMNKNDYFIRIIKYNSNAKSSSNAYCNLWTFRRKHSMHKLFELFSIDEFNGNEIQVWSLSFNICITVNVVKKKLSNLIRYSVHMYYIFRFAASANTNAMKWVLQLLSLSHFQKLSQGFFGTIFMVTRWW